MIVFTSRFFYYDSSVNDQNYREYSRVYDGAYGADDGGAGSNLESFVATQNKERKNNASLVERRDYLMKT